MATSYCCVTCPRFSMDRRQPLCPIVNCIFDSFTLRPWTCLTSLLCCAARSEAMLPIYGDMVNLGTRANEQLSEGNPEASVSGMTNIIALVSFPRTPCMFMSPHAMLPCKILGTHPFFHACFAHLWTFTYFIPSFDVTRLPPFVSPGITICPSHFTRTSS